MDSAILHVVLGKENGNPFYTFNMLQQLGYFCKKILLKDLKQLKKEKTIVVLVGPIKIEPKYEKILRLFMENGGAVLAIGNIEGIEDLLGCEYRPLGFFPYPIGGTMNNSVGEGYLEINDKSILFDLKDDYFPLHGFSCTPVELDGASIMAEYKVTSKNERKFPAIMKNIVGNGMSIYIAPDIAFTVRYIQEGKYVDQDGIPPDDGMSPIDDGILKCEDGLVLDWQKDRRIVSKQYKIQAFMVPVADVWTRILSNCVVYLADQIKMEIEKVAYWPKAKPFVMMISHDTDGNSEKLAKNFLNHVNQMDIKTTWCLIPPGYSPKLCKSIEESGHELAFHFDAQSFNLPDIFSYETLKAQLEETMENTKIASFYSNKNHYTRWQGRIDFFLWLEQLHIKIDQSKGPSKCGTLGFPFGTAHPWQAMDNNGRLIDCLEICFQSQDIGLQGPPDTGSDIVDAVLAINGVCHFIFHPAHYEKKHVQTAFIELVEYAKSKNALFMRSIDIGEWIFQRREFIQSFKKSHLEHVVVEKRNPFNKCWKTII